MDQLHKKWGIVFKAAAIVTGLLVVRIIIDTLNLDLISVTTIIGSFVGGAIFTIAIILAGILPDFKEAEKIPGELANALKNIYHDSRLIQIEDRQLVNDLQAHTKVLLAVITQNFRNNFWRQREITPAIDAINDDIAKLAEQNVPPQFLVKLRNEVSTIDRISNRVEVIMETSFIPAAYTIAEVATAGVLFILLFITLDPFFEGLIVFFVISLLLVSMLLLLKEIDNPFEVGEHAYAGVDFEVLWKTEDYFKEK